MATKAPMPIEAGDLDILKPVAIDVPCGACGRYFQVTLSQVLLSQSLLHDGCMGRSDTGWLPLTYTSRAIEATLREFERSWRRIRRQVCSNGTAMSLSEPAGPQ